jgi:hypothetical protein
MGLPRSITHLDDAEAQNGGSNIANQHAGKSSDKHVRKDHGSRLRAGLAEDKGCNALVDLALG